MTDRNLQTGKWKACYFCLDEDSFTRWIQHVAQIDFNFHRDDAPLTAKVIRGAGRGAFFGIAYSLLTTCGGASVMNYAINVGLGAILGGGLAAKLNKNCARNYQEFWDAHQPTSTGSDEKPYSPLFDAAQNVLRYKGARGKEALDSVDPENVVLLLLDRGFGVYFVDKIPEER